MYNIKFTRILSILFSIGIMMSMSARDVPQQRRPIVIPITISELEQLAAHRPDRLPIGPVTKPFSPNTQTWVFLGPLPILNEYWSGDTNASGRLASIIVHPTDPDVIYCAGAQGGVWKSTDGGVNWTPLTDYLSSLASGDLAFDPADPDVILYGTGEQHFSIDSFYGDGLFKTTDAGATWNKIALKDTVGSYIARIKLNPTNSNIIHLASDRGYLQSTDGGASWTVRLSTNWCTDLALSPSAPSLVFAAMYSDGIYKSTDDGSSWNKLTNGLPSSGFARINMAISLSDTNVIYASFVANNGSLYGMYKTTNCGTSWFNLPNTPNYLGNQGWYDNCVIVHPTNTNICYAGGVFPYTSGYYGIIKTTDGGNSWTDITIGIDNSQIHPDQHCLAFGPDTNLWVGNDGGIWKTTDQGQTWINCNQTLGVTQFYTLAIHPTNSNFLIGGTQDNGSVRYDGNSGWPQLDAGDGGPAAIEWDSPNIYYTTYVYIDPIYKWNNGVYQGTVTGPWSGDRASWCNGPLVVDPNQNDALLAGTYRVFRTTNSGGNWTQISGDLTGGSAYLRALAVSTTGSDTIYSGSSNGRVYLTTDGSTWNPRYTGLPNAAIPDVIIDPTDWQTTYVCADRSSSGRIYKTTDAGLSWSDVTGDLATGLRAMSMTIDFSVNPLVLYVGTDYGVYYSTNGGTNWSQYGTDLPNVAIYEIGCDTANGFLVAATHGRGMWQTTLSPGVEDQTSPSPPYFGGMRIITNPIVGNRFEISLNVVHPGNITFVLYDISGKKVRDYLDRQVSVGTHRLAFTVDGLSSGVYFLHMDGISENNLVKLVIMK
jgi:photosystem II stability/assembly factor-like uncharacterized protein